MKKSFNNTNSQRTGFNLDKNILSDEFKTTNINILLNRVRVEKKNIFKKKLLVFSFIFMIITFISIIFSN